MKNKQYDGILTGKRQLGPYPMEKLRRVERPTTRITDNIQRPSTQSPGPGGIGDAQARPGSPGGPRRPMPREQSRFVTGASLGRAMALTSFHLAQLVDGEVASSKAPLPAPEILSRHIKRVGYFMRADIVGVCELPQYAVYSHDRNGNPIELNHKFAIVILVDQDYGTMNGSTGSDGISSSQSMRGYSAVSLISEMMANYIKGLGYPARAHHPGTYQLVVPPLLLLAGIGEISRAGIVLNPFLGMRFKAAAVTTDLPLVPDRPVDFGLQEFCRKCLKCAVDCPSRAIPDGDTVMYNGYETWRLNVERCRKFRFSNPNGMMCGRCVKVCPWNKPEGWTHDVVRWLVQHAPLLDSFIVKMDDVWGYGKQDKRDKWWFDLEDISGAPPIPESSDHLVSDIPADNASELG